MVECLALLLEGVQTKLPDVNPSRSQTTEAEGKYDSRGKDTDHSRDPSTVEHSFMQCGGEYTIKSALLLNNSMPTTLMQPV